MNTCEDCGEECGTNRSFCTRCYAVGKLRELPSKSPDPTVNQVCAEMVERSKSGLVSYGMTTADNPAPASEWLRHAKHEMMDAAIYLQQEETAALDLERRLAEAIRRLEFAISGLQIIAGYDGSPHSVVLTAQHYLALSTLPAAKTG